MIKVKLKKSLKKLLSESCIIEKFKYTFFIKSKLKEFLIVKKIKQNLDFYKIADRIVKIREIPINDRGKIDTKSLKNEN